MCCTGLMRILLDIHPSVRCGPEPVVTREILRYRRHLETMSDQLSQSGITDNVLDDASAAFIATVIQEMGPQAPRLCHKDPSSFIYLEELADLFPKAKFIHMIRDGRAAIASTIHFFSFKSVLVSTTSFVSERYTFVFKRIVVESWFVLKTISFFQW
ncbi:putative kunitz-type protease inhibitor [Schistosoma mansoni]|uniref:putative kunitz-type protease inhibitor n=1 Tax=Schistosoma mansoni TaxID=6183 RepID=UPI00022DC28F|nr:putative kunitz-type protease inhibitor [Schistosoma mansoni]|eukprot:XP_018649781.1 putative kunitz-type protease inhibitor [Schistosoma mansoni]